MRRHISKLFMACLMAMTLMVVSAASAFAAGTGMDWSGDSKITVQGTGVAPTYAVNAVQARMLARSAFFIKLVYFLKKSTIWSKASTSTRRRRSRT